MLERIIFAHMKGSQPTANVPGSPVKYRSKHLIECMNVCEY